MANIKFSAFTQKVVLGDVDFLVGYTGADNVRVAPSVLSSVYLPLAGGTMTGNIASVDNVRATYGTGADLNIYHDGATSRIQNTTGDIRIMNFQDDGSIIISSDDGSGGTTDYIEIKGSSGAVELSHYGTKKFETTATGASMEGTYPKIEFIDDTGIARNFSVGTNNETFTVRNETGGSDAFTIYNDNNATFVAKVRANNWFQGADGTNTLYATSSTGVLIETPGSTASNNDSKIFFRNSGNIVKHTFDTNNGDATFAGAGTFGGNITAGAAGYLEFTGTSGSPDLIIKNNTATSSTSGTATLKFYQANTQAGGKIVSGRDSNYSSGATRDSHLKFYTSLNATDVLAVTIDSNQDATFAGNVGLATGQVQLGTLSGGDLKLYWDGADGIIVNKTGDLKILNQANDKGIIFASDDGSGGTETYFYLDGLGGGGQPFTVWPDAAVAAFGSNHDMRLEHTGSSAKIDNYVGDLSITNYTDDGDLSLRCDNGSGGSATYMYLDGGNEAVRFSKDSWHNDNVKALFGTGTDLEIYHDGSNSYISDTGWW